MKTLNNTPIYALAVAVALLALTVAAFLKPALPSFASTIIGGEYHATTTSTGRFPSDVALVSGSGTLGSVVITGAAAGVISIYNATTSDVTKRAAALSSSSILIASIPASAAAGTYTFDVSAPTGLYVDIAGTMPTTTITFR